MKRKILSVLLLCLFINMVSASVFADTVYVRRGKKPDASSSGSKVYKIEPTEEELKAREEAAAEYSTPVASQSIDIKPYFEDWTTAEALKKVNNIGTRLLLANDIDDFVRFSVSRKEAVNATASYSGEVQVYKGLLNYVETEDELAYVLGHELGHIYKKDARTGIIRKSIVAGALSTGIVLAAAGSSSGTKNTGAGMILAGSGAALGEPKFTRIQESRADIFGIDFMVKAGYNPLAAISMMNKIMNRNWDIVSFHPSGDKRMIAAYNYIEKKYPKYLKGGYDTISYKRALKYIQQKQAKKGVKQTSIKNTEKDRNAEKSKGVEI